MNEIASSFVSLTPRNDGILEFLKYRHCEGSEAISLGHRHCEGAKRPKQSHLLSLEILNEIASSFVLLTPRNDGILDGILDFNGFEFACQRYLLSIYFLE